MSTTKLYPCFLLHSFFISPYSRSLPLSPCVTADWAVGSVVGRSEDAAVHINNAEPQLPPSTVAMAPAHRCHQGGAGNAPLLSLSLSLSLALSFFFFSLKLTHAHILSHIRTPTNWVPTRDFTSLPIPLPWLHHRPVLITVWGLNPGQSSIDLCCHSDSHYTCGWPPPSHDRPAHNLHFLIFPYRKIDLQSLLLIWILLNNTCSLQWYMYTQVNI